MRCKQTAFQIVKFYVSATMYYLVALIFGIYIFKPQIINQVIINDSLSPVVIADVTPVADDSNQTSITIGKPTRIIVPNVGIDLTVIDGLYDPSDQSWTLTKDKAHFAIPSLPANDRGGSTLIYGHNTPVVFKKLSSIVAKSEAKVYTDNGHIFTYSFIASEKINPNDTTTFNYSGSPVLTLQTCSGIWSELRELFIFKFERVEQV